MREIVDCHIHLPLAEQGRRGNCGHFLDFGAETFVERLKSAGVTQCCGTCGDLRAGPAGLEDLRFCNESAYRMRDRYPDFYLPAVHAHPEFPDESCAQIERAVKQEGVRWIGEMAWYGFGRQELLGSPEALGMFRLVEDLGATLNIHCNDHALVRRLAESLPRLRLVLAHPRQDIPGIRERVALVRELPNLHLDLSGSGLHRYGMLHYAIEQAGAEKFLWGSDFPLCGAAGFIADVLHEPITEAQRELVFSGNFKRLTAELVPLEAGVA
ncbi:MAG: amidohydrolase [Planctomycetota bacterium]|nr:amidohydrolase [Planctomycetota bacterium]